VDTKKRYSIKRIMLTTLWVGIAACIAALLVAGVRKNDAERCRAVEINIKGVSDNFFLDKADILNSISVISNGNPVGKSVGSFNLRLMEKELQKNEWVKSAELFFDNNATLQVIVHEREPVARVFSSRGVSFYIDDENAVLTLSEKFSARLPVFTGFPAGNTGLTCADSNLLNDIKKMSLAIRKDSFRMALIEQVDITPQGMFEMVPKIGNQAIIFGDAANIEEKFYKLQVFYKEVMVKAGWGTYSQINLQYKGQVVARRRGAEDVSADSLRTLQVMQQIADNAERQASDSLQTMLQENEGNAPDSSMIQQSIERDVNPETSNDAENVKPRESSVEKPVVVQKLPMLMPKKPAVPVKKGEQKPGSTHKPISTHKPNDY
jgi:cell division protein FtsQ